jgi:hypothetical protein
VGFRNFPVALFLISLFTAPGTNATLMRLITAHVKKFFRCSGATVARLADAARVQKETPVGGQSNGLCSPGNSDCFPFVPGDSWIATGRNVTSPGLLSLCFKKSPATQAFKGFAPKPETQSREFRFH